MEPFENFHWNLAEQEFLLVVWVVYNVWVLQFKFKYTVRNFTKNCSENTVRYFSRLDITRKFMLRADYVVYVAYCQKVFQGLISWTEKNNVYRMNLTHVCPKYSEKSICQRICLIAIFISSKFPWLGLGIFVPVIGKEKLSVNNYGSAHEAR